MKRALLVVPFFALACAQLLSYDDYSARPASTDSGVLDAVTEAATDADAAATGPAQPPVRPAGDRKPSGTGKTLWLGVKHYHVGEQNLDDVYAPDAFKYWGFDIDHVCTSQKDSIENIGTCRRNPEAQQTVLTDGERCRDNNFGALVVPLVHAYSPDFEKKLNDSVLTGSATWVLRIDDLDPGEDDPYAPAKLYRVAGTETKPPWNGTDVRQVLSDSIVGGDLEKPINDFPGGYLKGNVWVAGDPTKTTLVVPITGGVPVPLGLEGMIMTLDIDPTHTTGGRGMIGGGLPADAIDALVRPIAAQGGFCPGTPLYDGLLKNVQRMPDLVAGEPNLQNATKPCDTLSIGIGFDVSPVAPATEIVAPTPPPTTKCDDAGVPPDGG